MERLDEDRYRYTSFDLLGCGASGGADTWDRCTIGEYGADLTALCDVLDIDRPVVLGHSLGAATILSAALANPGLFAGLVLVAPASTTGLDFLPDEGLATLDVPSILICGDRDRHVPLRNHLATQQAIPRCGLQVYFDIGHVPFTETTDSCAADVERFLATID